MKFAREGKASVSGEAGFRVGGFPPWQGTREAWPVRVLMVPASALFRSGAGWRLFVLQRGRARYRDVVVGERSGTMTQITTGLERGNEVVLFPSDKLTDGARVRARNRTATRSR